MILLLLLFFFFRWNTTSYLFSKHFILTKCCISEKLVTCGVIRSYNCVERTPKGEWLLAVLPADCKLSWKKLRAIHGKGTRIATEEADHFGSVVVTVSCHLSLSKILIKLFNASTSIIYCALYPPRSCMTKSVCFSYCMSHCIAIYRDEHVHWFFHSGGHRSHRVLAGSRSTSCCGFCFQGGRGFCH